jgi:hypothetical protein
VESKQLRRKRAGERPPADMNQLISDSGSRCCAPAVSTKDYLDANEIPDVGRSVWLSLDAW